MLANSFDWTAFTIAIVLLAVPLFVVGYFMLRRTRRVDGAKATPLVEERTFTLKISNEDEMACFKEAISKVALVLVDDEDHHILAKQGFTIRSWGQWLEVELVGTTSDASDWRCRSWPTWEGTLIDWGAGRRLVTAFLAALPVS
jgi:hypothetical protein